MSFHNLVVPSISQEILIHLWRSIGDPIFLMVECRVPHPQLGNPVRVDFERLNLLVFLVKTQGKRGESLLWEVETICKQPFRLSPKSHRACNNKG